MTFSTWKSGVGISEAMRITNSGNVGIGTATSSARLHVADSNCDIISESTSVGQSTRLRLKTTTREYRVGSQNDNFWIYDSVAASYRLWIKSDGNVGINTTGPSEKLEVVGNIKITAALLSNQDNTDVDTGTETVANVAIATYTAAFFDFVVKKTTNVRSGTVYACHDGTSVVFTETSTNDLGDTSDVTLSVDISGTNMRLLATVTSDDWSVKSLIRAI